MTNANTTPYWPEPTSETWQAYKNCEGFEEGPHEFGLIAQQNIGQAAVCQGCVVRVDFCPTGPSDEQLLELRTNND